MLDVEIPKDLLPFPRHMAERMIGSRLPAHDGVGSLLAHFLTRISSDANGFTPADASRLGAILVDLVSALLAHTAETDDTLALPTPQRTLLLRIRHFIEVHLRDPYLTPGAIAAAHHISTSYLHRLFQPGGVTVSAWIRRQRLERGRAALADPALKTMSIEHISAGCGFLSAAAFTRLFHATYGIPPGEYRRRHQQPGP